MSRLRLTVGEESFVVRVALPASSPTHERLMRLLPLATEAHPARVAGSELFFQLPFILPIEDAVDVREIGAGALIYSPERALAGLFYGSSAEVESVTLIGTVEDDAERVAQLAEVAQRTPALPVRLEAVA